MNIPTQSETKRGTFIKRTAKVLASSGKQTLGKKNTEGMSFHEKAVRIAIRERSTLPFPSFFVLSGKRNPRKLKIPAFSNRLRRAKGLAERALPRGHSTGRGSIYRNSIKGIVVLRFRVSVRLARRPSFLSFLPFVTPSLSLSAVEGKVAASVQ